jgi:hypothetical protein
MKRGGLILAAFLLISGVLRVTGPASPSARQTAESELRVSEHGKSKIGPQGTYQEALAARIQEYYGVWKEDPKEAADLLVHWNVPVESQARESVQFVIALLPDPVHTHLALQFDRGVEVLQQAAQKKGYAFDRAILPWDRASHPDPEDFRLRLAETKERRETERFPGLMIFRKSPDQLKANASQQPTKVVSQVNLVVPLGAESEWKPLFVWIVGETPTGGVHKDQFRNALRIICEIRGNCQATQPVTGQPFLILGPSFSGSLESLSQELKEPAARRTAQELYVYSGTVTDARSIRWFEADIPPTGRFASFQENDDHTLEQFLDFACNRGYERDAIAVLSEDETVYGSQRFSKKESEHALVESCTNRWVQEEPREVIHLHFPREISSFRSAYQKQSAGQPPTGSSTSAKSTLPLDLGESGNDDDSVAPYGQAQTPASQEAVMLGIVSELQKHHIKFTVLYASDPLDQVFLARFLRSNYPQGRVVVTTPDLLLAKDGDTLLQGVLGVSTYALLPGLSDKLCRQELANTHEDRLFASSSSIGTYNAMIGLLSVNIGQPDDTVPLGPYAEYASPFLADKSGSASCAQRPLPWVIMLGQDGFWPVAGLSSDDVAAKDQQEPIAVVPPSKESSSSLKPSSGTGVPPKAQPFHTPPDWNIVYCLSLLLLVAHASLSFSGSILANSEARAQFARDKNDPRGASIIALGALSLATAFVLVMCTRNPRVDWQGFTGLTTLMWIPYPAFVVLTIWDLGKLRGQPKVAAWFALIGSLMTIVQLSLAFGWLSCELFRAYWSTRMLHLTSGLSPVLPILLLLGAGYWWMWISLRGACLVDLRRPRLPEDADLKHQAFRISDKEAEELRETAHPLYFSSRVVVPIAGLAVISLIVLDHHHPVQTLEGWAYDWGYALLLGLMVATYLGGLLKLVWTWDTCRLILAGLDRLPLREAFSRMHRLSWHSFWNPGGSTIRETYKVMSRALENLDRLDHLIADPSAPVDAAAREIVRVQIAETAAARTTALEAYRKLFPDEENTPDSSANGGWRSTAGMSLFEPWSWLKRDAERSPLLQTLKEDIEALQKRLAKTAAVFIVQVLKSWWSLDDSPSVSTGSKTADASLPAVRLLAEEFVALIYVNFLVTVLLRMRTLVMCAGGMYVFIMLSMNVYPFEPHPALQTLAIALLILMGAVVGYVYAQMHREAVLSRLTSTEVGELGVDFWIKFGSAAAIPLFSLLATQFPQFNQALFSWLTPALEAVK